MEERSPLDIRQYVDREPVTVPRDTPVRQVLTLMAEHSISAVLVMDGEGLAGIFTERDLVRCLATATEDPLDKPVSDLMTAGPVTVDVHDRFNDVYTKMKSLHIRHLPIVDGNELVGIVSMRDLMHTYQNMLISQYEETRQRLRQVESLFGLDEDDRIQRMSEELDKYKRLSMTDELTGLYNKRYFTSRLTEEVARSLRYGSPLSLILADVDQFKAINDEHGHDVGDRVLGEIGAILAKGVQHSGIVSRLRKSDIVARYGGEEFVVILPETAVAGAVVTGEKLRRSIAEHVFADDVRATLSLGVAEMGPELKTPGQLVKHADVALYRAKTTGRNRVEAYAGEGV